MMMQKRISRYISRAICISVLLALVHTADAQQRKIFVQQEDSIAFFRGVAVSFDVVGAAQLQFSDYGQYEAALRVNLKDKYFPIVELGLGKADAEDIGSGMSYKTSAPYGRLGVDFNMMKDKHDIYRLYAGLRYGFSSFKFDVADPNVSDPIWGGDVSYGAQDVKCTYHWMELVFGVDAKIWGPCRLGWSVRYRRRLASTDNEIGNPWYVPGYGRSGQSRLGATFNVIFEL